VTGEVWRADPVGRPPAALVARLDAIMARYGAAAATAHPNGAESAAAASRRYLDAAERLLADLMSDGCMRRQSALDLLAADALVTYAFEVASADPERLQARADAAMRAISSLASAGDQGGAAPT
jgi:hypothetical protein